MALYLFLTKYAPYLYSAFILTVCVQGDVWPGTYVIPRSDLHISITIISCRNGNLTCLGVLRGQRCGNGYFPAREIKFQGLLA
jgi:hypothetical protein